jgi:hypothetical protein
MWTFFSGWTQSGKVIEEKAKNYQKRMGLGGLDAAIGCKTHLSHISISIRIRTDF